MDLSEFYESVPDLIASELGVLEYLKDNPYIRTNHEQLSRDSRDFHESNRRSNKNRPGGFTFNSYFELWHRPLHRGPITSQLLRRRPANIRLQLSGKIVLDSEAVSDVTYAFAVCRLRRNRVPAILRKFHFDVTAAGTPDSAQTTKQKRPQFHLQYCGTLVPTGCQQSQLDQFHPWLSEPRIFFWPMSLGILLDMALHEFADQRAAAFRDSPEWRSIVRKQEGLVLKPFFKKCIDVLENKKGIHETLAKEFYV